MCGCYKISFDYAETFSNDPDYELHKPYSTRASAEWIFVDQEDKNRIIIQHLLVMNDSTIIKHWRQDWLSNNRDLLVYNKDMTWNYKQLSKSDIKGKWTQKVYQVDDSPRYQGISTWVHVDGKDYWENTADSPLPRRERTKRSDYNVMKRTSRHEITEYGWVHEQDNEKILREDGVDMILAHEKGLNKYVRIPDEKCAPAVAWWNTNKDFWRQVRAEWETILEQKSDISIRPKVESKYLWRSLFEIAKSTDISNSDSATLKEAISNEIRKYVLLGSNQSQEVVSRIE